MNLRPIPATAEMLPVIGCGTYNGFDCLPRNPAYARLPGVLNALFSAGGRVLDSSPMYGHAEATTGELLEATQQRSAAFIATKVWTQGKEAGIRQMEESMRRLRVDRIDLMQVHNLVDWQTHLVTLRRWKELGRIRYFGITHYSSSAYADVESVLRSEKMDFLQINYSFVEREAEKRLLPLAIERGVAVLVNMPFGGGGVMRRLGNKPLPSWAAEIACTSWSQLLLKFVLSNPAVTCVIPGSSRPEHMAENAAAGSGESVDSKFWVDKYSSIPSGKS